MMRSYTCHPRYIVPLLAVLFILTLFCASMRYLGVDEIYWQSMNGSRIFHGEWYFRHYFMQCLSNYHTPIPWSLVPGRLVASLFYPTSLTMMVIHRVVIYLLMTGALYLLAIKLLPGQSRALLCMFVLSLVTQGLFPFRFVHMRPEIFLSTQFLGLVLLYVWSENHVQRSYKIALNLAFLLLASFFFGVHPKVVFFIPAMLVLVFLMNNRRSVRMVMMLTVLIMSIQSYGVWVQSLKCPDNQGVRDWTFGTHAVFLPQIYHDPQLALRRISEHVSRFEQNYIHTNTLYYVNNRKLAPENYAPQGIFDIPFAIATYASAVTEIVLYGLLLTVLAGFLVCIPIFRKLGPVSSRRYGVACSVGVAVAGFIASAESSFYDSALVWPMVFLLLLFALSWLLRFRGIKKYFAAAAIILTCLSTINQLIIMYALPVALGSLGSDMPAEDAYSKSQLPVYGQAAQMHALQSLAKECDISLGADTSRLVFDHTTYPAITGTRDFIAFTPWGRYTIHHLLKHVQAGGMLTSCKNMPKEFTPYVVRRGPFCCVPAELIARFP